MSAKNEKYKSKKQEMRHERKEGKMERKMEYGDPKAGYCSRKPCK